MAGLNASERKRQVEVVAHVNDPWPTPTQYPMTRLGFSVTELIARCIESIQAQRRGEEVPKITILPVFFEHEF